MKYYDYKTRNRVNGKIFKGIITADDLESATDTLKKRGEDIIEVDEIKDFMNIRKTIYNISSKASKKIKLEFFIMMNFMLESGMSLHETLVSIRDSSENKAMRNLARAVADEVRKGSSLSVAMKKSNQFDDALVKQINAGEEAGNINDTLKRVIAQMEREIAFKGKIKGAMIYPIMICIVMVIVLVVMMTMVVPTLAETLVSMGGELPMITKIVIGVSNFMTKTMPYFITLVIAAFIGYRIMIKDKNIKQYIDTYKLKIPIVGKMLEKIELSRFCRNLSAMQKSGISLVSSLKIVTTAVKNQCIAANIEKACKLVEISGMNLAEALRKSGNFPETMTRLIEVGINSGQICQVLDKISLRYEDEVDASLKKITSLLEPVMIVFVGIIAGVVVISVFIPMWNVVDFM